MIQTGGLRLLNLSFCKEKLLTTELYVNGDLLWSNKQYPAVVSKWSAYSSFLSVSVTIQSMYVYLFIYGLFNCAINSSYIASNYKLISE
jgi:hypothetical protein